MKSRQDKAYESNSWFFDYFEDPVLTAWREEQAELESELSKMGGKVLTAAEVNYYLEDA